MSGLAAPVPICLGASSIVPCVLDLKQEEFWISGYTKQAYFEGAISVAGLQ